jgi:hypothetical protein
MVSATRAGREPPVASLSNTKMTPYPWTDKINPLWWVGNADDQPPAGYTGWSWFLRNPFHNFFFYVVGVSDRVTKRYGICTSQVFVRGFNATATYVIGSAILWLPFLSYLNPHFRAYFGWRPGGAFGIKLNYSSEGTFSPP